MSLVINTNDAEQFKAAAKQFVNKTIAANNSGMFGMVESTLETGIVDATIDALFQYLEQQNLATAKTTAG